MNEDRNGTQQTLKQALCGRLALSMQADEPAAPALPSPDDIDAPAPRRPSRLSTSERLRRLEEFSAA